MLRYILLVIFFASVSCAPQKESRESVDSTGVAATHEPDTVEQLSHQPNELTEEQRLEMEKQLVEAEMLAEETAEGEGVEDPGAYREAEERTEEPKRPSYLLPYSFEFLGFSGDLKYAAYHEKSEFHSGRDELFGIVNLDNNQFVQDGYISIFHEWEDGADHSAFDAPDSATRAMAASIIKDKYKITGSNPGVHFVLDSTKMENVIERWGFPFTLRITASDRRGELTVTSRGDLRGVRKFGENWDGWAFRMTDAFAEQKNLIVFVTYETMDSRNGDLRFRHGFISCKLN